MDKNSMRRTFLQRRKSLAENEIKKKSTCIADLLITYQPYQSAGVILFYASIQHEVNVYSVAEGALKDKVVCFPKIKKQELLCYSIASLKDLQLGEYNIPEPSEKNKIPIQDIDLILIPGIAFDRAGFRIGYGRGYYDRLLEKAFRYKIGLAYDFQIVERLQKENHDQKVDCLITEKGIFPC